VNNFDRFWRELLGLMDEESSDANTYLRKRLCPKLRKCWNIVKNGTEIQIDAQIRQLREELIETLPATPYYYGFRTKDMGVRRGLRFS
jgi:hypothetical protein